MVIAMAHHVDQTIMGRYEDMLDMAKEYPEMVIFYNGPKSGASAPDHHHFQAAPAGMIPLVSDVEKSMGDHDEGIRHYERFTTGVFVLSSSDVKEIAGMFYKLLSCIETPSGELEPLFNLFTYWCGGRYRSVVVFRSRHRSHHYFSEGPDHLTMSPGCADMGGLFVVPVKEDFEKLTPELLAELVEEVSISKDEEVLILKRLFRTQPQLEVGIMIGEEIEFEVFADGKGQRKATFRDGRIEYDGQLHDELYFKAVPSSSMFAAPSFALYGVTIGVKFHWERQEDQQFAGDLKIIVDGSRLRAINVVGVEDYLLSVISSEMSSNASEEFLKAHAVISRSWVMKRMCPEQKPVAPKEIDNLPKLVTWLYATRDVAVRTGDEYVKWYDHDDHKLFHVCADDHCQRYQGLTRAVGDTVRRVIDSTWGQVLMHDGEICDARFSKSCGGIMETFGTCWQDKDYAYLQADEDPFCKEADKEILSQVLNNYDQETVDFYEWTEEYTPEKLGGLIERKFGVMTGPVLRLEPLERGKSGRISLLRIVGELKTITVGKELEIRRILSESHLKSSAFEVEYVTEGESRKIRLHGRGWGHGVGLCQIGAAVMASRGYSYRQILEHYYKGTEIYEGK
jgi:SpoIID/LytB domain protein